VFEYLPIAGSIGMMGVIVECVIEAQEAYNLVFEATYVSRKFEEDNFQGVYKSNLHHSYYYPGGLGNNALTLRKNSWNLTDKNPTIFDPFNRLEDELRDHLVLAFIPKLEDKIGATRPEDFVIKTLNELNPKLTLPSYLAFTRQLYYQHEEIEFGIPISNHTQCIQEVMIMLQEEDFRCVIEVRFAPDKTQALISPGTAGRGLGGTCFIELAVAEGPYGVSRIDEIYRLFEKIMLKYGGHPHLGKRTYLTAKDMAKLYGKNWKIFQDLRRKWDPQEKFLPPENAFLTALFKE